MRTLNISEKWTRILDHRTFITDESMIMRMGLYRWTLVVDEMRRDERCMMMSIRRVLLRPHSLMRRSLFINPSSQLMMN